MSSCCGAPSHESAGPNPPIEHAAGSVECRHLVASGDMSPNDTLEKSMFEYADEPSVSRHLAGFLVDSGGSKLHSELPLDADTTAP